MRLLICLVAMLSVSAASGCIAVKETVLKNKFVPDQTESQANGGVQVDIKVFDIEQLGSMPQFTTPIKLRYLYKESKLSSDSEYPWYLLEAPAFEITITNNTNHIIRGKDSRIVLTDASGRPCPHDCAAAFCFGEHLIAFMNQKQAEYGASAVIPDASTREIALAKAGRIPRFSDDTEIMPGSKVTFYTSFRIPGSSMQEKTSWLSSQGKLTLKIVDLVVETDEASRPTKRASFDYPVSIKTVKEVWERSLLEKKLFSSQEL